MKPASFIYHAPGSIDEAVKLLQRYEPDARVLAGGQSLVPMMNFRIAAPAAIIDINRIPGLAYIKQDGCRVRIGAMTRQRTLEFSGLIAQSAPLLHQAVKLIGHLPTRSRGTIGGSLAHADPSAELPMILQALEGEVAVCGPGGERTIGAEDLFRDALVTSLAADEILVEVRLPVTPAGAGCAVEEFSRRHGDFAIAAIAALVVRDGPGCAKARLSTAGIASRPTRLRAAEAILEAKGLDDGAVNEAADRAAEEVDPVSDQNASAAFRRHLTRVLTHRALTSAAGRAL